MAKLVAALATSHVPLMVTHFNDAPPEQARRVLAGFERLKLELSNARPDVLIVLAPDHFRTFFMDVMPPFCIGIGEVSRCWGDWGLPSYGLALHQDLARTVLALSMDSGFDLAYSLNMPLDHGFVMPLHYLRPASEVPIVPLFINCAAPPLPSLKRCHLLGQVLEQTIAKRPANERIALLASGGLSHWVPFPKLERVESEFDKLMADFMVNGRAQVQDPEIAKQRRAGIEAFIADSPRVNEEFDKEFLRLFAAGEGEKLADYSADYIEENGGNGGQEIRTWIALLGAVSARSASYTLYEGIQEWLTGAGMAIIDVDSRANQ
jgi:2,3-dihydroxyphenylpropionate 1,2-dioxygenase